ncbi:Serine/threonine-protein kinase ATG1 [Diplodia seriata]|uniref:Serine/threonine-protein kinase ATG1 n=1 Tax=Diplodia seriata TaxID=420778 RepID=A0A1S8BDY6_9PEZI|nr:Serine/threonine-protein kinase ATG1 [Diplodia seriata]
MIAPVFKGRMKHYELHKNTVLPFIPLDDDGEEDINKSEGGYSDVFTARIHTSHHKFHSYWEPTDQDHKVAIKRLHHGDWKEFEKERSIHVTLGQKQNASPHLVKLLATYELQEKYHFIFPRANCNLRRYWSDNPTPSFTAKTLFWSLKQMAGIATALNTIHNFRVTVPLDGKGRTLTGEVEHPVKKGEELYGRHGDIKPENILWFKCIPQHQRQHTKGTKNGDDGDYEGGILQITDFGLGRFHGRDSKTEQQPNGVFGSPTYEPPECKLRRPVSRLYDLWSLGCLYLEFATWLLAGFDAIEAFSDHRACPSSINPVFSDDFFFKVVRDEYGIEHGATVRDGVLDWAQRLHDNPKCSEFIHDLVDLVMRDLLLIEARDRIQTPWLCVRLNDFLKKAEADPAYLCKPDHRPREHISRTMSESAATTHQPSSSSSSSSSSRANPRKKPSTASSPKKVSFSERDEFFANMPELPKDLVLRTANTPSKSKTWPPPSPDIRV